MVTSMAMGQGEWGYSNGKRDGDDRSIDYNGTVATAIAMALGQEQQEQQEARGMGQRRSHCDRSIMWMWTCGARAWAFYSKLYSKR
jgi:hypothetical protein